MKPLPRAAKAPPLKVLYTATELARAIGVTHYTLIELLRRQGVLTYKLERVILIPLAEIKDKLEPVWDAICLAEQLRQGAKANTSI